MSNDTMGGQIKTALIKPEGVKQGHYSGLGNLLAADAAPFTVSQTGC